MNSCQAQKPPICLHNTKQSTLYLLPTHPTATVVKIQSESRTTREYRMHHTASSYCSHVATLLRRGTWNGRPALFFEAAQHDLAIEVKNRNNFSHFWSTTELLNHWLELAGALAQLHAGGIAHQDIKPENILIYGTKLKLADFGSAAATVGLQPMTTVGTRMYWPAEMHCAKFVDFQSIDTYCMGCTFYVMATLLPWSNRKNEERKHRFDQLPQSLRLIVEQMLDEAETRIKSEEVVRKIRCLVDRQCPLCNASEPGTVRTRCGHSFHEQCLAAHVHNYLRNTGGVTCPECFSCFVQDPALDDLSLSRPCLQKLRLLRLRSKRVMCPHCVSELPFPKLNEALKPFPLQCPECFAWIQSCVPLMR